MEYNADQMDEIESGLPVTIDPYRISFNPLNSNQFATG